MKNKKWFHKKTGPAAISKGEPDVVRIHPPQLDAWIAEQEPPFPSRPEAIRRLLEIGLIAKTNLRQPSAALAIAPKSSLSKPSKGSLTRRGANRRTRQTAKSADQRAGRVTTIAASPWKRGQISAARSAAQARHPQKLQLRTAGKGRPLGDIDSPASPEDACKRGQGFAPSHWLPLSIGPTNGSPHIGPRL